MRKKGSSTRTWDHNLPRHVSLVPLFVSSPCNVYRCSLALAFSLSLSLSVDTSTHKFYCIKLKKKQCVSFFARHQHRIQKKVAPKIRDDLRGTRGTSLRSLSFSSRSHHSIIHRWVGGGGWGGGGGMMSRRVWWMQRERDRERERERFSWIKRRCERERERERRD